MEMIFETFPIHVFTPAIRRFEGSTPRKSWRRFRYSGQTLLLDLGQSLQKNLFMKNLIAYRRWKYIHNSVPPEKLFELNNCPGVAKTQVWEVNDNLKKKTSQRCNCRELPKWPKLQQINMAHLVCVWLDCDGSSDVEICSRILTWNKISTLFGWGLIVMLVLRSKLAPTAVIPYTTACSPWRITFTWKFGWSQSCRGFHFPIVS